MKNSSQDTAGQNNGPPVNTELLKQWRRFRAKYKTEADCCEKLYEVLFALGLIVCKRCYGVDITRQYGSRIGRCKNCRTKIRITAGTFFHGIRTAEPWVAAIFLKGSGAAFNTAELNRLLGHAYSSSWEMLKKIVIVINTALMSETTKDSHSRIFISTFRRRSLETPAKAKPIAEQTEIENSKEDNADKTEEEKTYEKNDRASSSAETQTKKNTSQATDNSNICSASTTNIFDHLNSQEKEVLEKFGADPLDFPTLAANIDMTAAKLSSILVMLELKGLIENLPGEVYVRSKPASPSTNPNQAISFSHGPGSSALINSGKDFRQHQGEGSENSANINSNGLQNFLNGNLLIPNFMKDDFTADQSMMEEKTIESDAISFIISCYRGISRKYLQFFLAAYWCHLDRVKWSFSYLLRACAKFAPVRGIDIRAYRSPLFVKLALPIQTYTDEDQNRQLSAA